MGARNDAESSSARAGADRHVQEEPRAKAARARQRTATIIHHRTDGHKNATAKAAEEALQIFEAARRCRFRASILLVRCCLFFRSINFRRF